MRGEEEEEEEEDLSHSGLLVIQYSRVAIPQDLN